MSEFNFKSKICTSREQSDRLSALGLKKETADMGIIEGIEIDVIEVDWEEHSRHNSTPNFVSLPAWSLGRLVEIIKNCNFENFESEIWRRELKTFCINLLVRHSDDLFENAIQVIEMLICRGYFNNEYLIQKRKS